MSNETSTRMERLMDMVSRIDERSASAEKWREKTDERLDGLASKEEVKVINRRVSRLEGGVLSGITAIIGMAWLFVKDKLGL